VWTFTGQPIPSGRSLGRHGVALQRDTVATATQPCDRIRLLYDPTASAYGFGGGALQIRIDGEVVDVIDCSRSELVGCVWDSGPLGAFATRRIELSCVAGDFVVAGHSYFHDGADGETGPLFWHSAHSSHTIGRGELGFASEESTWLGAMTKRQLEVNPFTGRAVFGSGSIEADCFLCSTGTNDIRLFKNDPRLVTEGYRELFGYLRARCDSEASIIVIIPTASALFGGDYEPLAEGITAACDADGAFVIDLLHDLGTHADDSCGFYYDGYHPNDEGHAAWADAVSSAVVAAIQPFPAERDDPTPGRGRERGGDARAQSLRSRVGVRNERCSYRDEIGAPHDG
jgi:hypothetical protein